MILSRGPAIGLMSVLLLSACSNSGMDWDLRRGGGFDTSEAARGAADNRPQADANGVISYPGYQVVVARRGDTVAAIAQRLGTDAGALASYNALRPSDTLRDGEVLALPNRVSAAPVSAGMATGGIIGSTPPTSQGSGQIDVSSIASSAIDRAAPPPAAGSTVAAPKGGDPVRHKVQRGETAYTVARAYNVSAKSLADWNGLGSDLAVREGQVLTIPTSSGAAPTAKPAPLPETTPGQGSPTPPPPSAQKPLPKDEAPAAQKAKETPKSPEMSAQRTGASATKLVMPVSGKIIRSYQKKKNEGIDISAAAGTAVKAADAGTVAAVTKDTNGTPIVVIRHADNMLTVYAGVDSLKVQKGATVSRGQAIAVVRGGSPAFLHFEVRRGVESVDPMPYLQ
jgi:murein DD-endopeptidase MepM/ murein hydrolase activator NlpD